MFNIFKNVIETSDFDLRDILNKIEESYIKSSLSKEEQTELEEMARQHAKPENSYTPLKEQLNEMFERIKSLEGRVSILEGNNPEEPTEPVEEYPEYVKPTGAHDAYNTGDKITYNGKHYECIFDGCVWNPDEYPTGWKEVEE
nr:MAG TPA: hypothetical protein [Caudoviricetes sp.]